MRNDDPTPNLAIPRALRSWVAGALIGAFAFLARDARAYDALQSPPASWVASGVAYVDTFPADPATLRYNAAAIFLNDGWLVAPVGASADSLRTLWKPLNKFFVRILFGNVQAQCRLTFRAVDARRTRVTFTANAATPRQGAMSTLRANADRAYAKAARDWAAHMRRVLAHTDMPSAAAWAAAREVSPPPAALAPPHPGSTN